MTTATTSSRTSYIQWLIESRPASLTWPRSSPPQPNQPPLDLIDHGPDLAESTARNDRGVRVRTVKACWAAQPRQGLPDAEKWSTTLALAVIQALLGQRPVAHANICKGGLAQRRSDRSVITSDGIHLIDSAPSRQGGRCARGGVQLIRGSTGTTSRSPTTTMGSRWLRPTLAGVSAAGSSSLLARASSGASRSRV